MNIVFRVGPHNNNNRSIQFFFLTFNTHFARHSTITVNEKKIGLIATIDDDDSDDNDMFFVVYVQIVGLGVINQLVIQ